jgi:two-component system LytT family response regulator
VGFTVLIAENEPQSVSFLSSLIDLDDELSVVDVCTDGDQAAARIHEVAPDIALLGTELPGMSGLDIADRYVSEDGPKIIFVSASEKHACRSFELNAFDYLVKPIEQERFCKSLARVKRALLQDKANRLSHRIAELVARYTAENANLPVSSDDSLVTRSGARLNRLEMRDIVWIEASNQYLRLHTDECSFVISESLSGFLEKYKGANLCRVHRSHAINLEAVEAVQKKPSGRTEVLLRNGTALAISRSRQTIVPTLLKWSHDQRERRIG